MEKYTQDNRPLRIETILGKNGLLLAELRGTESVSNLFEFELVLHSTNHNIRFDSLIGENASIFIKLDEKSERPVNGYISEFQHTGTFLLEDGRESSILSEYRAKLVPWFWKLQLNRDSRIFQNKSTPEIISEIFSEYSQAIFEKRLFEKYEPRNYCVQYRESDFNFVSRLMEEEGIFYYFEHSADEHKLILGDFPSQFKPLPSQSEIKFVNFTGEDVNEVYIKDWKYKQEMRSESYSLKDYSFRNPSLNLHSNLHNSEQNGKPLEIYDYPGEYQTVDLGNRLVQIRYEEERSQEVIINANSNGRIFMPGFNFDLTEHPRKDFNLTYTILRVEHTARQETFRSGGNIQPFSYESSLTCIPYPTIYRPVRKTPIPKIKGSQTAIVVGPKGEEIFVDKHGRIKVQFHWDRIGKRNQDSSCWIRVSQPWAGTGFGGITIPRIGQEVIVDFLEGDPDRPIITGRVYNGASRPPYDLPANKAHSGLMSRSTPKGGSSNFNGIRMDDNIGSEGLEIQAEKDERILVKNDKQEKVGNNESIRIGVDRSEKVGNNESLSVGNDQQISVGNNRSEEVGNNEQIKIGSNRNTSIGDNDVLGVGLTRTHSVGINEMINIGAAQEISVGAVQIVTVGIAQVNNIGLKQKTNAGKEISLEAPRIILKATEELTLKCGAGVITFDAAGNITIKSPLVKINT